MLVHIKKIIGPAVKKGYAIGAFNVNNLEMLWAVLRAAKKTRSAVIIQTTEGALQYAGLKELAGLIQTASQEIKAPVALHLDHGHDLNIINQCIRAGYSSVMIDGSALPYKQNVALTKRVVRLARPHKVWVQAELGRLEGLEDWVKTSKGEGFLTDPEQARQFVLETRVNTLAVAIGNYHGVEKLMDKRPLTLDLKRLARIAKLVPIPLVLHGASGFNARLICSAIERGICIVNIDSELRVSFTRAEHQFLNENKKIFDPRKILGPAIAAMQKVVEKKIKLFKSPAH